MGEIVYKELMMTRFNNSSSWTYVMERSKTEGKNIDTFEKAKAIIDEDYSSIITYTLEEISNEIYMVTEQLLPCRNCGSQQ
jgi:hypothetical protein